MLPALALVTGLLGWFPTPLTPLLLPLRRRRWGLCGVRAHPISVRVRQAQVQPKLLICADGYTYNGKRISSLPTVAALAEFLTSVEKTIIFPFAEPLTKEVGGVSTVRFEDFLLWLVHSAALPLLLNATASSAVFGGLSASRIMECLRFLEGERAVRRNGLKYGLTKISHSCVPIPPKDG